MRNFFHSANKDEQPPNVGTNHDNHLELTVAGAATPGSSNRSRRGSKSDCGRRSNRSSVVSNTSSTSSSSSMNQLLAVQQQHLERSGQSESSGGEAIWLRRSGGHASALNPAAIVLTPADAATEVELHPRHGSPSAPAGLGGSVCLSASSPSSLNGSYHWGEKSGTSLRAAASPSRRSRPQSPFTPSLTVSPQTTAPSTPRKDPCCTVRSNGSCCVEPSSCSSHPLPTVAPKPLTSAPKRKKSVLHAAMVIMIILLVLEIISTSTQHNEPSVAPLVSVPQLRQTPPPPPVTSVEEKSPGDDSTLGGSGVEPTQEIATPSAAFPPPQQLRKRLVSHDATLREELNEHVLSSSIHQQLVGSKKKKIMDDSDNGGNSDAAKMAAGAAGAPFFKQTCGCEQPSDLNDGTWEDYNNWVWDNNQLQRSVKAQGAAKGLKRLADDIHEIRRRQQSDDEHSKYNSEDSSSSADSRGSAMRILFLGDSVTRNLFHAFARRAASLGMSLADADKSSSTIETMLEAATEELENQPVQRKTSSRVSSASSSAIFTEDNADDRSAWTNDLLVKNSRSSLRLQRVSWPYSGASSAHAAHDSTTIAPLPSSSSGSQQSTSNPQQSLKRSRAGFDGGSASSKVSASKKKKQKQRQQAEDELLAKLGSTTLWMRFEWSGYFSQDYPFNTSGAIDFAPTHIIVGRGAWDIVHAVPHTPTTAIQQLAGGLTKLRDVFGLHVPIFYYSLPTFHTPQTPMIDNPSSAFDFKRCTVKKETPQFRSALYCAVKHANANLPENGKIEVLNFIAQTKRAGIARTLDGDGLHFDESVIGHQVDYIVYRMRMRLLAATNSPKSLELLFPTLSTSSSCPLLEVLPGSKPPSTFLAALHATMGDGTTTTNSKLTCLPPPVKESDLLGYHESQDALRTLDTFIATQSRRFESLGGSSSRRQSASSTHFTHLARAAAECGTFLHQVAFWYGQVEPIVRSLAASASASSSEREDHIEQSSGSRRGVQVSIADMYGDSFNVSKLPLLQRVSPTLSRCFDLVSDDVSQRLVDKFMWPAATRRQLGDCEGIAAVGMFRSNTYTIPASSLENDGTQQQSSRVLYASVLKHIECLAANPKKNNRGNKRQQQRGDVDDDQQRAGSSENHKKKRPTGMKATSQDSQLETQSGTSAKKLERLRLLAETALRAIRRLPIRTAVIDELGLTAAASAPVSADAVSDDHHMNHDDNAHSKSKTKKRSSTGGGELDPAANAIAVYGDEVAAKTVDASFVKPIDACKKFLAAFYNAPNEMRRLPIRGGTNSDSSSSSSSTVSASGGRLSSFPASSILRFTDAQKQCVRASRS